MPISRQRRWQLEKKKQGNCIICGKPRKGYASRCGVCEEKHIKLAKMRYHKNFPKSKFYKNGEYKAYGPRAK